MNNPQLLSYIHSRYQFIRFTSVQPPSLSLLSKMISKGIKRNLVTYNCLIQGVCNFGRWREAATLLNEMVQRKIMLDVHTYSILVDTFCKEGMLKESNEVFDVMIQRGIEPNIVTYNSLIDGYCI